MVRRADDELPFLNDSIGAGSGLLLDTSVYIDQMQGKAPAILDDLIAIRIIHHSTIAIQEMLHTVGALDPRDPRSGLVIATIEKTVEAMPPHRILAPDADVLAEAAVQAGILCRLQGYARDDKLRALHDSVLFLQALKLGAVVLTRNVREFDLLMQLRPEGRALFYRLSV